MYAECMENKTYLVEVEWHLFRWRFDGVRNHRWQGYSGSRCQRKAAAVLYRSSRLSTLLIATKRSCAQRNELESGRGAQ